MALFKEREANAIVSDGAAPPFVTLGVATRERLVAREGAVVYAHICVRPCIQRSADCDASTGHLNSIIRENAVIDLHGSENVQRSAKRAAAESEGLIFGHTDTLQDQAAIG